MELHSDMLEGADQIAAFIYGDRTKRGKVYHLVEANHLPVFKLGKAICARKSTLLAFIAQQEGGAA